MAKPRSTTTPIAGPWEECLTELIASARTRLVRCAPYITDAGVRAVRAACDDPASVGPSSMILTDLSSRAACQGATEPAAVADLAALLAGAVVVHLPGLHAKVYAADGRRALVTSGNLTAGGLRHNHEYGLHVDDAGLAARIERDVLDLGALGAVMDGPVLIRYCDVAREAAEACRAEVAMATGAARRRLEAALHEADTQLVRARLAGGALHTVLARTIVYLLERQGAMCTEALHGHVQRIHPDLCDDAIDRVIDGKRFGKKWKHAVRTAQQQLKKAGRVTLEDGRWRLVP